MARKSSKAPNKGARGLFRVTVNLKLRGFESVLCMEKVNKNE